MSEMIERVARAVATELGDDFDLAFADKAAWLERQGSKGGRWRDITEPTQADFIEVARAVIQAMREPTAAMIQTACPSHTPGVEMSSGRGECPHHRNAAFRWRQMIDEALK